MRALAASAAFLIGIVIGDALAGPGAPLLLLAGALLVTLFLRRSRLPLLGGVLLICVSLGALRASTQDDPARGLDRALAGETSLVVGLVLDDAEPARSAIRFPLRVERALVDGEWATLDGVALVTANAPEALGGQREPPYVRYGDRVTLEGALAPPPALDGFDYPAFLARQGIGAVVSFPEFAALEENQGGRLRSLLHSARRSLAASLGRVAPEPAASLGQAILLGQRENLSDDVVDAFRRTGTSHLLAISGLHVGILLALTLSFGGFVFGRRRNLYLLLPLAAMWGYALLAGFGLPVVRASIMGTAYLAAHLLGRPTSILPALGLAAAVMVGLTPSALWSVSFQLSFAAMAGIATISEPLSRRLREAMEGSRIRRLALTRPAASLALGVGTGGGAILATLPLTAFYFQQVSLIGLPTTLLTLPLLPLALVFHAIAGAGGMIAHPLGVLAGWAAWGASSYVVGVVTLASRFPAASFETGAIAPALVIAYYAAGAAYFAARRVRVASRLLPRLRELSPPSFRPTLSAWLIPPAALAAVLLWMAALAGPDGDLRVIFADVGNGDAILIVTPSGRQALIDGGRQPLDAARLLDGALPFWDRSLDLVVLSHAHADHVGGLIETLRRYDVHHILERPAAGETAAFASWRRAVNEEGAEVTQAVAGDAINLGDGVIMEILHPGESPPVGTESDLNNASVVLRVVYGEVSFLLTGDVFKDGEREMLSRAHDLRSNVLKAAHHGSRTSSSPEFIGRVSPSVVVISVAEDNPFGHPHAETLDAFRRYAGDAEILATAQRGDIEFRTDGMSLSVKTER